MAKNGLTTRWRGASYRNGREIWAVNVTPLVTAARQGASEAARAARRERARATRAADARRRPWWRQRWVTFTAAGVLIGGAAAGAYAAMARQRNRGEHAEDAGETRSGGIVSTMEAGRAKVADATRTVVHKLRRTGSGEDSGSIPPDGAKPASQLAREDVPTVGAGH